MHGGGAERVAALLCNAWAEEGHEVMLMPTFSGRGECIYELDPGVQLRFLSDLTGTTSKTFWISFRRLLVLRQTIKRYAPDVIVSFLTNVNVAAIVAATGTGVPVIVSERIYPPLWPLPWFRSVMRRLTYPRATCLVAQTEMAKEWLEEHCQGSRVKVIPNPVMWPLPINKPVVEPQNWVPPGRKLLLAAGRLHRQKGFDLLLVVFSDLVKDFPDWDLVILGEGHERGALEAKRAALGLERHVFMPGLVGNASSWYELADLYVMTSRYEGFPNTLLEAMAHGVPAVSFDCDTGPRDLIRHEVNGVLVPLEDGVEGLATATAYLMRNEALRCRMGEAACEVREKFSMGTVKDCWAEVLKLGS